MSSASTPNSTFDHLKEELRIKRDEDVARITRKYDREVAQLERRRLAHRLQAPHVSGKKQLPAHLTDITTASRKNIQGQLNTASSCSEDTSSGDEGAPSISFKSRQPGDPPSDPSVTPESYLSRMSISNTTPPQFSRAVRRTLNPMINTEISDEEEDRRMREKNAREREDRRYAAMREDEERLKRNSQAIKRTNANLPPVPVSDTDSYGGSVRTATRIDPNAPLAFDNETKLEYRKNIGMHGSMFPEKSGTPMVNTPIVRSKDRSPFKKSSGMDKDKDKENDTLLNFLKNTNVPTSAPSKDTVEVARTVKCNSIIDPNDYAIGQGPQVMLNGTSLLKFVTADGNIMTRPLRAGDIDHTGTSILTMARTISGHTGLATPQNSTFTEFGSKAAAEWVSLYRISPDMASYFNLRFPLVWATHPDSDEAKAAKNNGSVFYKQCWMPHLRLNPNGIKGDWDTVFLPRPNAVGPTLFLGLLHSVHNLAILADRNYHHYEIVMTAHRSVFVNFDKSSKSYKTVRSKSGGVIGKQFLERVCGIVLGYYWAGSLEEKFLLYNKNLNIKDPDTKFEERTRDVYAELQRTLNEVIDETILDTHAGKRATKQKLLSKYKAISGGNFVTDELPI